MAKMGVITADRPTRGEGASRSRCNPQRQPNDCTAVAAAHNDWGFFCDYFRQWWDAQPAVRRHRRRPGAGAAQGGYTVVTSLDPGIQAAAAGAVAQGLRRTATPGRCRSRWSQPGTGRVLAHGRQPALQPGRRTRPGSQVPQHRQPARSPAAAASTATRPARHSRCSPCWPRWRRARRWTPASTRRPAGHPVPRRRRRQLRRLLVPGQRQPGVDGRLPDHVERLRPLGEHVLRLAGASRSAPANAVEMAQRLGITFRAPTDADLRQRQRRRLGRVHPRRRRHHPARPGQRVRDGRRRGHVLRAAAGDVDRPTPTATGGRGQPELQQVLGPDVARGRHRRGPLPGRPAVGVRPVRRRHRREGRPASWAAGRSPARPAAPSTTRPRRSSASPRRSRRPASPPTRTTRRTSSARRAGEGERRGGPDHRDRAGGQPVQDFTAPSRELAGDPQRPKPQPAPRGPTSRSSRTAASPSDILRWLQNRRG